MAVKIEMPKLSDTQDAGVLATWKVEEGDQVESGDVVAEVETDKATMDVEVFDSGTILKILVDEGTTVPLGGIMAVIGEEGEDISDILNEAGGGDSSDKKDGDESSENEDKKAKDDKEKSKTRENGEEESRENDDDKEETSTEKSTAQSGDNERIKASPLARNMADDK